jgi:hypothetical protein
MACPTCNYSNFVTGKVSKICGCNLLKGKACSFCHGDGHYTVNSQITCPDCGGFGDTRVQQTGQVQDVNVPTQEQRDQQRLFRKRMNDIRTQIMNQRINDWIESWSKAHPKAFKIIGTCLIVIFSLGGLAFLGWIAYTIYSAFS